MRKWISPVFDRVKAATVQRVLNEPYGFTVLGAEHAHPLIVKHAVERY